MVSVSKSYNSLCYMKTNVPQGHMASVPWYVQPECRTVWWIGKYTTHWHVRGSGEKTTTLIYDRNIQTFIKFEWGGLNPFVLTHHARVLCLFMPTEAARGLRGAEKATPQNRPSRERAGQDPTANSSPPRNNHCKTKKGCAWWKWPHNYPPRMPSNLIQ